MKYVIEFQKKHGLSPDGVIGPKTIAKMREVFGINDSVQLAHFLANTHHETGGFSVDSENLNYSAKGLAETWPKRYALSSGSKQPNALAKALAGKPQAIANNTYADRNGNGNEKSGDGWRFRGRGSLQLTGRKNYELFSDWIKDPEVITNPDIVATKYFWETALFYFTVAKLWPQMKYADPSAVKEVRRAVNGGTIGLKEVQDKFNYYRKLIG